MTTLLMRAHLLGMILLMISNGLPKCALETGWMREKLNVDWYKFKSTFTTLAVYSYLPIFQNAKSHLNEVALYLIGSLAVCYSRMGKPQTTIAANAFHF